MLSRFSCVQLFVTPWTIVHQFPLPMGFSRQEYWSELPFPSPGYFPDPGIEPTSLMTPALAGRFNTNATQSEQPSSKSLQTINAGENVEKKDPTLLVVI